MNPEGSMTAKLCAFARAYHSENAECKIADDYLAHAIMGQPAYGEAERLILDLPAVHGMPAPAGEAGRPAICPLLNLYLAPIPLSRLAYTEERLHAFARAHERVQYVICGAGLDTFSLRNGDGNVRVFEVDHPCTQAYKIARALPLQGRARGEVRYIPLDFAQGDLAAALHDAGFDDATPTFFAVPGVSYYLPHDVFEGLVRSIAQAMPPESELMFDYPEAGEWAGRCHALASLTARLGEPMAPWYTQAEIARMLARHGLGVREHLAPPDIQAAYFEGRDDGQTAYENVHFILAA